MTYASIATQVTTLASADIGAVTVTEDEVRMPL